MKRLKPLLSLLLMTLLPIVGCKKEQVYQEAEAVTVDAAGYVKSELKEGARLFCDREYAVSNVHPYFIGFEMLISPAESGNGGVVTSLSDGFIYLIAPVGTLPQEWVFVPNTADVNLQMSYSDGNHTVALGIYARKVSYGQKVEIPVISSFLSPVPLARHIGYLQEEVM